MNGSTLRLARPTPSSARALATAGLALVGILPAACFDPLIYDPPGGGSDDRDDRDDRDGTSSGEGTESSDDTGSESSDSSGAPPPVCGDGIVEGDEICDDGVNNGSYAGCASGCGAWAPTAATVWSTAERPATTATTRTATAATWTAWSPARCYGR